MCGIAGYIDKVDKEINHLNKMIKVIENRGPDSSGIWSDKNYGIYIGHTRKTILDLSKNGSLPMLSRDKRYLVSFNGEIYNHAYIRGLINKKDKSYIWQSNSDTETICKSLEVFGLEKAISILNGMFAISVWDKQKNILYIARDGLGEKPVYYFFKKEIFLFGSTIKCISSHPKFEKKYLILDLKVI